VADCFGIGEHAPDRVLSLVTVGQHPYEMDRDGPLAGVVGEALAVADIEGIEPLITAFEAIARASSGRGPGDRALADPLAMQAAYRAVIDEGPVSPVTSIGGTCRA
jgi:hypothetical protein